MIGEILAGRYRCERLLGQGGMGAVYEATHLGTGRRVAVKVITGGDLTPGDPRVARFQREARAAGALVTDHIAGVLDSGEDPTTGSPFMVMEYLEGEDLQQLLKRNGPLPPDAALRITAQACLGLQKAHDAGVIHRDIKPANLFLCRRDEGTVLVKVLDFGIAKIRVDDTVDPQTALTNTGSVLGSPHYLSPEQARAAKDVDPRTDVWSLGVTLYRALTGRTPHEKLDSFINLMMAICLQPAPPVQEIAPWVPAEVAEVVHRALAIDRDERFPSAAAMLDAIRPLLPGGFTIHDSMLVPLDARDRAASAAPSIAPPRASLASVPPKEARVPSIPPPIGATTPSATASWAPPPGPRASSGSTPEATPAPQGSKRLPVLGAVGLAAAVALGAFVATRSGGTTSPASPPLANTTTSAIAAATATATTSTAAPVVEPAVSRRVKLVLEPSDVVADVDGAPVASDHGVIDLTGPLGSIHRVHLRKGRTELTGDVAITEAGALPPKLELGAGSPAPPMAARGTGPTTPTTAVSPVTTPAAATPAAATPPATPGAKLRTEFE